MRFLWSLWSFPLSGIDKMPFVCYNTTVTEISITILLASNATFWRHAVFLCLRQRLAEQSSPFALVSKLPERIDLINWMYARLVAPQLRSALWLHETRKNIGMYARLVAPQLRSALALGERVKTLDKRFYEAKSTKQGAIGAICDCNAWRLCDSTGGVADDVARYLIA